MRPARGIGIAVALAASLAAASTAAADSERFIPWKGAGTPALSLKGVDGRPHSLADYLGKVVLVNFWATWCEPCRDEMPSMQKLEARLSGQPFATLAVNLGESPPRVREFAERLGLGFPVLLDPNQDASREWRVRVLPSSFVVAPNGRVRYAVVGEMDWASESAVTTVRALLR